MQFSSPLTRRGVLTGTALAGAGLLLGCSAEPPTYANGIAAQREAGLDPGALTLFFVESKVCPICAAFAQAYMPPFEASKERERIRLVVLHSPAISVRPFGAPAWVGSYQPILDDAQNRGLLMATPLFILMKNNKYFLAGTGLQDWRDEILPAIRKEVSRV